MADTHLGLNIGLNGGKCLVSVDQLLVGKNEVSRDIVVDPSFILNR